MHLVGCILLGLMLIRTGLRIYFGAPPLPKAVPYFIRVLAKLSHLSLYLLVFLMPLTGLLGWHTNSEMLLFTHSIISNCLLVLILTHICAVGFHEGVLGSQLIYRMGSFRKKNKLQQFEIIFHNLWFNNCISFSYPFSNSISDIINFFIV